jgi:hypothetical protein
MPAPPLVLAALALLAAPPAPDRFPKPDPAGVYAEYKVYRLPGDPLRRPVEDWEGARRRMAADPAWARFVAGRRKDLDDWMARRRDRVEWAAGWYHDFVSPKDASHLTFTPDEPGRFTLHSRSDPRVELTPTLHAAWVEAFRTAHVGRAVEAARLHRLTGERKYADWAAGQLDFYAANHAKFRPIARNGRHWTNRPHMMWQSLDEATVLADFAETIRLLDAYPDARRKALWSENLLRPMCATLDEGMQTIHNIACWHRSAVAQAALVMGDESLWKGALDGRFGLRAQLREGVTGDYLWYEQSLGYNGYVVRALSPLFRAAWLAGRQDELRPEMLIAQNLLLAPLALRFPDGRPPTPADAGPSPPIRPDAFASSARLFPTRMGLKAAAEGRDWDALLDPLDPPSAADDAALAPAVTRDLASSRMAVLVRDGWQVFVHYGQLTGSHAQAEALNFEADWGTTPVTRDTGTVGYGSPLHRDYFTRGLNHNVPLVDGEGQVGWDPGTLVAFDAKSAAIAVEQPRYRKTATARRSLRIEGGTLVDEVTIASRDGRTVGLVLQLQGEVGAIAGAEPDPDFARGRPAGFARWSDVETARLRDAVTVPVKVGSRVLEVRLATAGPFRLSRATTLDVPPRRRQALYLERDAPAATIRTTLAPAR